MTPFLYLQHKTPGSATVLVLNPVECAVVLNRKPSKRLTHQTSITRAAVKSIRLSDNDSTPCGLACKFNVPKIRQEIRNLMFDLSEQRFDYLPAVERLCIQQLPIESQSHANDPPCYSDREQRRRRLGRNPNPYNTTGVLQSSAINRQPRTLMLTLSLAPCRTDLLQHTPEFGWMPPHEARLPAYEVCCRKELIKCR